MRIAFPNRAKPGEVAHDTLVQLGIVYGPLAALPALLAAYFYGRYAIDERRHDEIQRALATRRAPRGPAPDGEAAGAPTAEPATMRFARDESKMVI